MIITVANQKGGAGKTTTVVNLGAALSLSGIKVLAVDMDTQANLSALTRVKPVRNFVTAIAGKEHFKNLIVHTSTVDVLPNTFNNNLDKVLEMDPRYFRQQMARLKNYYDVILIDTAPGLNSSQLNALIVADRCIIPAKLDYLSLLGLAQFSETLAAAMAVNPNLAVAGILVNQYQARRKVNAPAFEQLQQQAAALNTRVLNTFIRFSSLMPQAQAAQENIFQYAGRAAGISKDYFSLAGELIKSKRELKR